MREKDTQVKAHQRLYQRHQFNAKQHSKTLITILHPAKQVVCVTRSTNNCAWKYIAKTGVEVHSKEINRRRSIWIMRVTSKQYSEKPRRATALGQAKPTNTNNGNTIQSLLAVAGQVSPPLETAGVVGAATDASILGEQPIRQRVGRRLHEGRVGRNGARHNIPPSATELAMKSWDVHAARTVGGTGVTSCPPDFGTERHRRSRHRPEISPQPATTLLRPPEEQSRRSDTNNNGGKRHNTRKATSHYSSELHQTTPSMQPANKAMRKGRDGKTCADSKRSPCAEINKSHTKASKNCNRQSKHILNATRTYPLYSHNNKRAQATYSTAAVHSTSERFSYQLRDRAPAGHRRRASKQDRAPAEHRRRTSKRDRAPVEHHRRAIETALQSNIIDEQSRPRSSLTVSASLQWPGAPSKDHTLGAHPPALRCATAASSQTGHLPSTPKSPQKQHTNSSS
uniref:Uncharacterized protein n=1 Tax=Plectus sambesii TaxID=2011161 RepID=A0A914UNS8_9BILA